MSFNYSYKATLILMWGCLINAALAPALAVTPAQIPLNVGISAAKPNIMLMIDSSGSMTTNIVTSVTNQLPSNMPGSYTYNCKSAISGGGSAIAMIINPTGTPRFCKDSANCLSADQTNFSQNKCFKNTSTYTVVYYGTSSTLGPYTGLQLNWYFTKGTFVQGSLNATATAISHSRMSIAKQAATDLVDTLAPDPGARTTVRLGLAKYDNGTQGGMLLNEIKDLDAALATTIDAKINAITPAGITPLATTLSDIGKYFATGETGNLTLHPASSQTTASVNALFSKADGTTSRSITNATCGTTSCTNTLAAPILGYCQKSYAILISDGLPNGDREVSPSLRDYTGDCASKGLCVSTPDNSALPGASGVPLTATGSTCSSTGNWGNKACKNGTKAGRVYENSGSDYLDDVAQALFEMDLRPSLDTALKAQAGGDKNNVVTYAIGLADPSLQQDSVLKDAAKVGGGKFFFADDSKSLATALEDTIADIASKISSSASVVANSGKLDANSAIFQGKFDSADWTGSLTMFPLAMTEDLNGNGLIDFTDTNNNGVWDTGEATEDVNGNGKLDGGDIGDPIWEAADRFPAFADRNIITYNPSATTKGVAFTCANLSADQKIILGITDCASATDHGAWRVNYLRGDWSHELKNPTRTDADAIRSADLSVGIFRNRTHLNKKTHAKLGSDPWLLGDIVNSNPVYVSDEDYGYDQLPAAEGGSNYQAFVTSNASRRKMVYVGANDGMLHGFDASATGADAGKEMLAYIPNAVYLGLNALSDPNYNHQYLVDGSPRVGDVYIGGAWHTVLLGTTGAGGHAVFALDITDPSNFDGNKVLWEISESQSSNATDVTTDTTALRGFAKNMGYTMSQPSLVKMHDGSWAAIVANGYDSTNNLAVLYIINVQTGNIIAALDTKAGGATSPNGLSTPIAVDVDGDMLTDVIYAGDLLGNMWKFDVSSATPSAWTVANAGTPLFVACSDASNCNSTRQPITGKPQIGDTGQTQSSTGVMVYFGTGKYFEDIDNNVNNAQTQTFYGIWDNNTTVARGDLQAQSIIYEGSFGGNNVRATSNNTVNYPTKKGWYMDLLKPLATTSDGERVVSFPLLRHGRIIFVTMTPIPIVGVDICGANSDGTSWIMMLDALSGSRLTGSGNDTPWDINGDGMVNANDMLVVGGVGIASSGMQSTVGIINTPSASSAGSTDKFTVSGSKNGDTGGFTGGVPPSSSLGNRQSWRQIQ